jgi:fatty-acyl-CoA synthase
MRLKARLEREWRFWRGLDRTLKRVKTIASDSPNLICDDLQAAVEQWRNRPALTFEGKTVTYGEMDAIANRYAHWAKSLNLRRGQTVALFMPNRLEYFPIWYGLSKVGVITALINNQLSGLPLAHCLNISGAAQVIVDTETSPVFEAARTLLEKPMQQWVLGQAHGDQRDLTQALKSCSQLPPDRSVREDMQGHDTALYIFTSGTTGLPKAARITHVRAQLYMRGFAGATGATENDRVYVTLPLYHATGGLCGLGAALLNGGSAVIKRKFSATQFWSDVVEENCTMFVYIGELCRYLVNHPQSEDESRHKIRLAFGNGLRPDVWADMKSRFRIPEILEFYGSTEGNVSMFNFDGRVGAIGRTPKWLRNRFNIRLIQFDVETEEPVRGLNGLCIEAGPGQIGECVGHIGGDARSEYSGYVDKADSAKKVHRRPDEDRYRRLFLFRRPGRRHLPLEGGERLHRRGGRAAAGGARRGGGQCLRGDRGGRRRPRRHGRSGGDPRIRHRRPGRAPGPGAAALRPAGLHPHPARHRDHRNLQVPQDGPGGRRLRPRQGPRSPVLQGPRQGLPEAHQGGVHQDPGRIGEALRPPRATILISLRALDMWTATPPFSASSRSTR